MLSFHSVIKPVSAPAEPVPPLWRRPCRVRGFSLIELMTVLAIIAVLAAIAYPMYTAYLVRARRSDATRALMEASSMLERYYNQHQTYANAALGGDSSSNAPAPTPVPVPATSLGSTSSSADTDVIYPDTSPNGYYTLSLMSTSATGYTLEATPVPTGPQARDSVCSAYTLNNLGVRGVMVNGSNVIDPTDSTVKECWEH